jgi:integrase
MLFTFGINIGLRISDIIKVTIYDILDEYGRPKTHLEITETKTKKQKKIKINKPLADELIEYISALLYIQYRINYNSIATDKEERQKYINIMHTAYLFYSNKGEHLTRVQAYRILSESAEKCGIKNFGSHSLRKTFGYFHYKQNKDIAQLMELFNHSAPSITLRYIGINQDILDNAMNNFYL